MKYAFPLAGALIFLVLAVALSVTKDPEGHRVGTPMPAATPSTLEGLGGLAPGVPLGPFEIASVSEPVDGAVWVDAASPDAGARVTYEIRLASGDPLPAAHGGRYDVYYRAVDGGGELMAGAVALGKLLERAPKDAPAVPGISKYPRR